VRSTSRISALLIPPGTGRSKWQLLQAWYEHPAGLEAGAGSLTPPAPVSSSSFCDARLNSLEFLHFNHDSFATALHLGDQRTCIKGKCRGRYSPLSNHETHQEFVGVGVVSLSAHPSSSRSIGRALPVRTDGEGDVRSAPRTRSCSCSTHIGPDQDGSCIESCRSAFGSSSLHPEQADRGGPPGEQGVIP